MSTVKMEIVLSVQLCKIWMVSLSLQLCKIWMVSHSNKKSWNDQLLFVCHVHLIYLVCVLNSWGMSRQNKTKRSCWVWWYVPIIPTYRRPRVENSEFKTSLGLVSKKKNKWKQANNNKSLVWLYGLFIQFPPTCGTAATPSGRPAQWECSTIATGGLQRPCSTTGICPMPAFRSCRSIVLSTSIAKRPLVPSWLCFDDQWV